jgi:hypothetical protein
VYTYVPQQQAARRFEQLRQSGELAIDRSYYSSIANAAQSLDERLLQDFVEAEHLAELPVLDLKVPNHLTQPDETGRGN